jgi:hypothetical protein
MSGTGTPSLTIKLLSYYLPLAMPKIYYYKDGSYELSFRKEK